MLTAAVGAMILPGAGRKWVKQTSGLYGINPAWINAPFEVSFGVAMIPDEKRADKFISIIYKRISQDRICFGDQLPDGYVPVKETFPLRFSSNNISDSKPIPPFIKL